MTESVVWLEIDAARGEPNGTTLQLGYHVDELTLILCLMVTFIGSLIFLFSIGYMSDELAETVHDHELPDVHRRGRFSRFFVYLSLFVFAMLNLLIADNLFQIFVSWELVGLCSFFLIGFYAERPDAALAANKAFIVNRIGDAGFLVGIAIAWTTYGTLNIVELTTQITAHPPALWIIMGLGIFLGCVGKSAQFPLHTWLPDAMAGPTPVSALIHAATMVAAGVYLVARCYPMFAPRCCSTIAYTGAITLFLAATIATVQTDIKKVLAYSTVSQLGYMMLALGVGGWAAGLFHLVTHACFKGLLFLGSGSVIIGMHHEQEMTKMGGLRKKMPITALTMLIGVLAIVGTPLTSGWYSKDAVMSAALGFSIANEGHWLLFVLPLCTVVLTGYYMTRLWLLTFAGEPRDKKLHDQAKESSWLLTLPLILLAILSVGVGWGWPIWNAESSLLLHLLEHLQPKTMLKIAEHTHLTAGGLALLAAILGVGWAWSRQAKFLRRDTALSRFLRERWHIDELYHQLFVKPTLRSGTELARFDKSDKASLDGGFNRVGDGIVILGRFARTLQTGRLHSMIVALALTIVVVLGMLLVF